MRGLEGKRSVNSVLCVGEQRELVVNGHGRNNGVTQIESGAFAGLVALQQAGQASSWLTDEDSTGEWLFSAERITTKVASPLCCPCYT